LNYIDLIIAIPLIWGAFNGFRKGLVIEVASLLALAAGIYGAIEFSVYVASWLSDQFEWSENVIKMLAFVITFIAIMLVVHLIARLIQKLIKLAALGLVNRIFGAVFGVLKYLLITAGLLYIVNAADSRYPFIKEETKQESMLYNSFSKIIPWLYPKIEDGLREGQSIIA
jgi:membrane protein required for colicin V production